MYPSFFVLRYNRNALHVGHIGQSGGMERCLPGGVQHPASSALLPRYVTVLHKNHDHSLLPEAVHTQTKRARPCRMDQEEGPGFPAKSFRHPVLLKEKEKQGFEKVEGLAARRDISRTLN